MAKCKLVLIFFSLIINNLYSQSKYPEKDFISPVRIPIALAGTFGELRSDHFHSGIDIKTNSVEGHEIMAVADGWISRIKISPNGYGKAIYINHPNGYTSVYAHLKCFNDSIEQFVRRIQYEKESFAVDISIDKDLISLVQGEVFAYGGNSGGSSGPHLHFEIRNTKTQRPINPLLFGYQVADSKSPTVKGIQIVPLSANSFINGMHSNYKPKMGLNSKTGEPEFSVDTIRVQGKFGISISTYDQLNGAPNKNGIYKIKLFKDDSLVYSHNVESFSFAQSRYINSLIDYPEYIESKQRYQRSWIEPGNDLDIYENVVGNGIQFNVDSIVHWYRYEVLDYSGNVSRVKIPVLLDTNSYMPVTAKRDLNSHYDYFDYRKPNHFKDENLQLSIPAKALYDNILFEYSSSDSMFNDFSKLYHIHKNEIPVHKRMVLSIVPDSIPEKLKDKIQFVRIQKDDTLFCGGTWKSDRFVTKVRNFGDYFLNVD
ncbi:MAG: M23 family metallopeptidase, partial [Bacteroidales bacterium]|nr:M23 family metallopeptidase [Bacteroidales bacterium]